jgi:hypothetical protein
MTTQYRVTRTPFRITQLSSKSNNTRFESKLSIESQEHCFESQNPYLPAVTAISPVTPIPAASSPASVPATPTTSPAVAAAPASVASTAAGAAPASPSAFRLGTSFVNDQVPSAEILAVQGVDGAIGVFVILNFDEGKTAGLSRETVTNEIDA